MSDGDREELAFGDIDFKDLYAGEGEFFTFNSNTLIALTILSIVIVLFIINYYGTTKLNDLLKELKTTVGLGDTV